MTTIYKYELLPYSTEYTLPKRAKFLTVQTQHNVPQMWFEVEPNAAQEVRQFTVLATGEPNYMPPNAREYLGTFQLNNGTSVFHLFELL